MATYKFDDKTKFVLPSGFEYLVEKDDDGNEVKRIVSGKYYNDEGELSYNFMAGINELEVNYDDESATLDFKNIAKDMLDGTGRKGGKYFVVPGVPQCMFMTIPMPLSIFGVMIKSFGLAFMFQEDKYKLIQIIASGVYSDDEPKENKKIYENVMKLVKSVRVEGNKLPVDQLTAKDLQNALELTFNEDDETIDVSPKINLKFNDGDEEVTYEMTKDGFEEVSTEKVTKPKKRKPQKPKKETKEVEEDNRILPVDTIRLSDNYDNDFLNKYGKDIKRIVVPNNTYFFNYMNLSKCPNVEEFIIGKDTAFSFVDGVLYYKSGDKKTIEYVTKGTKNLHIDADITDISNWHGVDNITVDKGNSTFVVQDNMLLSRRKNSLYLVSSKARELNIPEGVINIHANALEYCDKLTKVVFPASYGWEGWKTSLNGPMLYVSEAVKNSTILIKGDKARYEDKMILTHPDTSPNVVLYLGNPDLCYIPAKLTSTFGFDAAFYNVSNFKVDDNNRMLSSVDGVITDKAGEVLRFYPRVRDSFIIPKSIKTIESNSVASCNAITDVVLPEHVETVGMMAFANCNNLKKVTKKNPKADIHQNAFFGCDYINNKSKREEQKPIDEQAMMRELDKEIQAISIANIPREQKKKERIEKSKNSPKQEFKYDEHLSFNLSEEFIVSQDEEDGHKYTELLWGEYYNEDDDEPQYKFEAKIEEMKVNAEAFGKVPSSDELIDLFVNEMPNGLVSRSFTDFASLPCAFISAENPREVPFGFFGNIVLKYYLLNLGVVSGDKVVYIFAEGYQNKDNDEDVEKEEILYEKMLEIAKSISLDGEQIDLKGLDDVKLREELEPVFADSESSFSLGMNNEDPEEQLAEVRFAEDDDRKVIVDNKWSFDLPKGLDLRFNSEHVDIMGKNTTADYVVEGLEYNGRFFFDFELHQRYDTGMDTDLDVMGCRYDNDVTSENANQKIIVDGDDLFVDIVHKPIFLFRSMVIIRVRGEDLRPWDFQIGLDSMDQDMQDKWDKVKDLMNKLAGSIKLLNGGKKTSKKTSKSKKEETVSDPDFIVSNGVLRKYIGKSNDIVLPDGIKEIGNSVFSGYSKIKSVIVPEGVKRIGDRCFENCVSLEKIDLPQSLEEIGGYAFADCHKLKDIYLSDKLKRIGDSAFTECFVLKDVVIPKKIKEIEAFAFKNCDAFTHIVIPNGVTTLGYCAFLGCDNLEYLFIPKSVTEFQINIMDQLPLDNCPKLTVYTPAGSEAQKFAKEHNIPYVNADKGVVESKSEKKAKTVKTAPVAKEKTSVKDNTVSAGQGDVTDDVAKMYVLMDDYERVEPYKNKSDFIKAHDEYFPGMKKTDMGKLYADVKSNRKKKAYKEECIKLFMDKPVEYRFDVTAKKCFHLSQEEDFRDRREEALLITRKWFKPGEEREVNRLLDSMMESIKKDLLSQIEVGGDNWTRFYSAKPDLEIVITDCDRGNTEIPEINSLFQHVAYFENALVTVNLSKGGYFGYTAELANFMPWIWGVSALDIWNAAFKNEINDKRSLPFGSESTARVAYEITEKTVEIPQNDAKDLVSKIKKIYDDCTDVDAAKKKLEELDKDIESKWYKFDKVRLRALRLAKAQKFDLLVNVLEESETLKQFQKDLPKAIIKDIPIRQAAKALKRAKDDLDSAKQTITRSETSIREYQKEIENDKKALEEKRKELTDFEEVNGKELEDDKFRISTNQERQRTVIKILETNISELEKNIEDTQNELSNTSFFKFSLKKELTAKIEELNAKLKECKDKLPEENSKLYALNAEYNSKVQRNQQEIDSMRRAIDQLSNRIKANTSRIPTLEQLIEDKKKAIPSLEAKVKELEK